MQTNKPPPPPGRPTIAQRVSAIQLATRSHSSPKGKVMARSEAMMIHHHDDDTTTTTTSSSSDKDKNRNMIKSKSPMKIHSMISTCKVDEMEEKNSRFSKNKRVRFMRWKNKEKYPRTEEEDEGELVDEEE